MTLVPERTLTREEIDQIWIDRANTPVHIDHIKDWTVEELAEEAQNPDWYEGKDDYLRAIADQPKGRHILVQLALALNEDLPSDIVDFLIEFSPYATVIETLIANHLVDEEMVSRARRAIDSIHALNEIR